MSNGVFRPVSPEVAFHRAGGRRHYNMMKQVQTIRRQDAIIAYLTKDPTCGGSLFYGFNTRLAKVFGVSRQTIHRDLSAVLYPWRPQSFVRAVDARYNYDVWWKMRGAHVPWWTDKWFGKWWEAAIQRNQDRGIWKSQGRNRYMRGLARKQSRAKS